MTVKVYVEGGGDQAPLKRKCREGFAKFFGKTALAEAMPRFIACGGRRRAYEKFRSALRNAGDGDVIVLLVDSEGPVARARPWQHLHERDGWAKPDNAAENSVHLMVQVMESWFLADKAALARFYGNGFRAPALPADPVIEEIPKQDVLDGLNNAARGCTKAKYDKGRHSFDLLGIVDPELVTKASPHAHRLLEALIENT